MFSNPNDGPVQRLTSLLFGLAFMALGILGLIFPVLPGWIFIFAALVSFAAAVPAMRRLASRIMTSGAALKAVDAAARSTTGRRLMGIALRLPQLRRGLLPSARWRLVRTVLRQAVEAGQQLERHER